MVIVILNLLIAIISDVYAKAAAIQDQARYLEKAQMI